MFTLPIVLLLFFSATLIFYIPLLFGIRRIITIKRVTPTNHNKPLPANPGVLELQYEDVKIVGADGDVMHGWLMQGATFNGRTILLLHGMQMSRYLFLPLAKTLCERGFQVLLPDHRAHGDSGGRYMTFGKKERYDIKAWLDFLEKERGVKNVGLFGISLGGVIGIQTAPQEPRLKALVIQSPYTTLDNMVRIGERNVSPWIEKIYHSSFALLLKRIVGVDMRDVDLVTAAKNRTQPILIIGGTKDKEVPIAETRSVYEAAQNPKEYLEIEGAGHNNMHKFAPELYWNRIAAFFERTLDE